MSIEYDMTESEFYLFGIPATESMDSIPLSSKNFKLVNHIPVESLFQYYEDNSLIPYNEILISISKKYPNDRFIEIIDKSFKKNMPELIKHQAQEIEKVIQKLTRLMRIDTKVFDLKKKSDNPREIIKTSLENIERMRKKTLGIIIDEAYARKSNLYIKTNMTNEDIAQYFACKFTVMNYDSKLIYPNMKTLVSVARSTRAQWNEELNIFNISLTAFKRLQNIDIIDESILQFIFNFQNNTWIESYLSDKIPSKF